MKRIDWSDRRADIERMVAEGKTDQDIADFYGTHRPAVWAARIELGIKPAKRRYAVIDFQQPIRIYMDEELNHQVKVYAPQYIWQDDEELPA